MGRHVYTHWVELITAESTESRFIRYRRIIRFPQLTMPLIAAYTPGHWKVTHTDEIVQKVRFDRPFSLVAITANTAAAPHAYGLAVRYREAVRRFHAHGIAIQAGTVFGFDHDERSIFRHTVEYFREVGIDSATIGILVPFPNTALFRRLDMEGRIPGGSMAPVPNLPRIDGLEIQLHTSGRLLIFFPYHPDTVTRIKAIPGRRWHPKHKAWSIPHTDPALDRLRELFSLSPPQSYPRSRPTAVSSRRWEGLSAEEQAFLTPIEDELKLRGYSPSTRKAYRNQLLRFRRFLDRDVEKVGETEIRQYLLHQIDEKKGSLNHPTLLLTGQFVEHRTQLFAQLSI